MVHQAHRAKWVLLDRPVATAKEDRRETTAKTRNRRKASKDHAETLDRPAPPDPRAIQAKMVQSEPLDLLANPVRLVSKDPLVKKVSPAKLANPANPEKTPTIVLALLAAALIHQLASKAASKREPSLDTVAEAAIGPKSANSAFLRRTSYHLVFLYSTL